MAESRSCSRLHVGRIDIIETELVIAFGLIALLATALFLTLTILVVRRGRERGLRRRGFRADPRLIWIARRK